MAVREATEFAKVPLRANVEIQAKDRSVSRVLRGGKTPPLAERLAAELLKKYPDGRPLKKIKEIGLDLKRQPEIGEFKTRTLECAIALAWPKTRSVRA